MTAEAVGPPSRPDFMITLGLLPPYTSDDVKAAYRLKVRQAHPDRGGSAAAFLQVEEAYQQAVEYVSFHSDRRRWIAVQVEPYLRQQEVAAKVKELGGVAEYEQFDWLKHSFGEGFALLAERLRVIRLRGPAANDDFLAYLAEPPLRAPCLVELDLADSRVTDRGLPSLKSLELLKRLNLAGTAVSGSGLRALLGALPVLQDLKVGRTGMGWWWRWRLRRAYPQVQVT
jgi:hypothetical protein